MLDLTVGHQTMCASICILLGLENLVVMKAEQRRISL